MPVKQKNLKTKEAPIGVKIISVLYYIGAVLFILVGFLMILGAKSFLTPNAGNTETNNSAIFILLGILMLGFAVLSFFIGRRLWEGKNWARIFVIILAALGIIAGIKILANGKIANSLIIIVIDALIVWYLLLSKEAKSFFS